MRTRTVRKAAAVTVAVLIAAGTSVVRPGESEARDARNTTRTNVNRNVNENRNVNVNQNRNVNVDRNVNVNRDVDIDVDVDHGWGWGHPVATAAAVTATAMVTSAVVGSMVYSLPPACSAVVINGLTYQQCGGSWYQPQYTGSQVTYVVVNPPR